MNDNMRKYTFSDIFASGDVKSIVIPPIQRDYVQGRMDESTKRIRKNFLDALYDALVDTPITLDFVYGNIEGDGKLIPLDGQQRLTTLFLLYWYAAVRDGVDYKDYAFLGHFSYETRFSSRDFCKDLVTRFVPHFPCESIGKELEDQSWFALSWKKDPTISSMLVVLDDINEKFSSVPDLWQRLNEGRISFFFLSLRDMGLSDDLYVKMNSRGKPLTRFEHFKADLEKRMNKLDKNVAKRIVTKIDGVWTDLFWKCLKVDEIDDAFLMYFNFICDVICYKRNDTTYARSRNEFDLLDRFFTVRDQKEKDLVMENIRILENLFDCWSTLPIHPAEFEREFFSELHEDGKVRLFDMKGVLLFENCLTGYLKENGERGFSFGKFVLLYALSLYLCNREGISKDAFRRRIRIVNNLAMNSENELNDNPNRAGRNRLPEIIREVDSIILEGIVPQDGKVGFNSNQLTEERAKLEWTAANPELSESLYELEDHDLLYGQIGIVGLENADCFASFKSLFACNWDKVDTALMATRDYFQKEGINGWRYQVGSARNQSAWRSLFHVSANVGMENTRNVLITLLKSHKEFSDAVLDEIKDDYIAGCMREKRFDFRYYYLKYDSFRPGSYGKLCKTADKSWYEVLVMKTETNLSSNTYQPFLMEIAPEAERMADDYYTVQYKDTSVSCGKDCIVLNGKAEMIAQCDGVDAEDRIEKGRELIASICV